MKIHSSSCEIEDSVETHLCKLCVCYSDRAYYGLCVLTKDIGRRLPLELQCSYQGQQGDVCQSVRGNCRHYIERAFADYPAKCDMNRPNVISMNVSECEYCRKEIMIIGSARGEYKKAPPPP